jgi:ketosteroid isomerase-like protein
MDSRGFHLATHFLLEKQTGEKTMKIKQAISSAILVVLLTAPTAWGQDNIRAAMEAANKEWSAAYNSMNGKAFPALYTKDAILMPPGVPPINGSEAIGQFWTDLIKAGNRKNFAIEIASIQRDGKYAYQTGRWTLDQVKDNGEVTKVGGVASVFSKNSRTASGWPRSTFTIFINWALTWTGCGVPPVLFHLPLHRRTCRVLHLDPVPRPAERQLNVDPYQNPTSTLAAN